MNTYFHNWSEAGSHKFQLTQFKCKTSNQIIINSKLLIVTAAPRGGNGLDEQLLINVTWSADQY